jgi:hypothetical protein
MLNVTMMEDGIISGELVELEDVGRGPERAEEEAGGGAGLTATLVSGGWVWLLGDTGSSAPVVALGGPFWFPSGPGGPFLFPCRPGALGFAGSRLVGGFRKMEGS